MPDKTPHTVTSFDDDLHRIRTLVYQMGALAVAQVTTATEVLSERDYGSALAVIATDAEIDALQVQAELAAVATFARHSPLAEDLREVMAALRIVSALERVGDYAKNMAKRATILAELPSPGPVAELTQLATVSRQLLRDAMASFLDRDPEKAAKVIAGDDAVDEEYNRTFRALLTTAERSPELVEQITHLQFVAKHYERVADQATNIAEQVQFADAGELTTDRRPIG